MVISKLYFLGIIVGRLQKRRMLEILPRPPLFSISDLLPLQFHHGQVRALRNAVGDPGHFLPQNAEAEAQLLVQL